MGRGTLRAALAISAAFLLPAAVPSHATVLQAAPLKSDEMDFDAPIKEAIVELDSPHMNAQVLAAMAMPYKYGVTQIPCKAKELQPQRGWKAAREPAGRIQWIPGPVTKVFWSGIYGTCLIQSPLARDKSPEIDRVALECECNGWMATE
jgi:hypothetical protein